MTNVTNIFDYQKVTILPIRQVNKADSASAFLEIKTPHAGLVTVEIMEKDTGILKQGTELFKKADKIIKEVKSVEQSAKKFLLDKWVKDLADK